MELARDARKEGGLHSCLYECSVMHHRLSPKEHRFTYRMFFLSLDLDEIDSLSKGLWGFSRNRWNLYTFRDSDHVPSKSGPVKERLKAYLADHGIELPAGGSIRLVTLPRVLGYIFNPVSFYFCLDAEGEAFCAVAEVGNTFGEMKLYLLRGPAQEGVFRLITPKHFYVSPFSALDLEFDFKLRLPGERLEIHIDDRQGSQRVLLSALTGKRTPLSSASLAWVTLKYPLITLRVIFLIHWHALLLWMKRLPFHAKSANADLQRDVLKPHASIAPLSHERVRR